MQDRGEEAKSLISSLLASGLNQATICRLTGIDKGNIRMWRSGKAVPRARSIAALRRLLEADNGTGPGPYSSLRSMLEPGEV